MPEQSDWHPDSSLTQHIELTLYTLQDPARPLIEQPRLTQRYLARPPFRFIHDIVTSVQQATGFAPGLYAGCELDARTIQGRDAKVAFLFKIMSVVSIVLHSPMPADPFKVVAGLEPENTNTFLQMLGKASTLGDASDIVQAVLVLEQNTQDAALSELQHSKQHGESEGGEDSELDAPGASSREDEQAGSQECKGMSQRLASIFSRLQGQFKQRFNKQDKDRAASDSPRSAGGAAAASMQEEALLRSPAGPSRSRASMQQQQPCGVEAVEPAGCLQGFSFSQQLLRKLTRSTSASLVVFKRNGSVVHPFPGKQAPSAQ